MASKKGNSKEKKTPKITKKSPKTKQPPAVIRPKKNGGGTPKSPSRLYSESLIRANKGMSNHGLARLAFKNRPDLYNSHEHARTYIRAATGTMGEVKRLKSDKTLHKEVRYTSQYLKEKDPKEYLEAQKRKLKKVKYYLITWAQNNTPIHSEFWYNIKAYAKFLGAEVHVILGRYKNPTSVFTDKNIESWDKEILPYSDAHRHPIHKHLTLLSDIKIQPTASNPLTSMESISGLNSAIFGHPKLQLDTIAALEGYEPKLLLTTGAVTKKNYTDSKAGKKGEFHHCFGFAIVEIKDKDVFIPRQVTALSNGSFSDLIYNVKDGKVTKVKGIAYGNLGDKHIGDHCPIVEKQQRVWLDYLKPKRTMVHDIFNGKSVNHHEDKDPFKKYQLEQSGENSVKGEIEKMMLWIESMKKYNLVIVASNHNDWLDRWVKGKDWKFDIKNAMEYMEYSKICLSGKAPKGLIAYLIEQKFGKQVITLGRNDSFRINEVELAQHGDIGANGSRGGLIQFKRLSTKIDVADSHVPRRLDGVFYVGTSTKLRVGYNIGASGWRNADVICHLDKKRQHIIYMGKDRDFTTFPLN